MGSAIQPLNNQGLVGSVTNLFEHMVPGQQNYRVHFKGFTITCTNFVGIKICSRNPSRQSNRSSTLYKNNSTFIQAYIVYLSFPQKKDQTLSKHSCKFTLPLYIISK